MWLHPRGVAVLVWPVRLLVVKCSALCESDHEQCTLCRSDRPSLGSKLPNPTLAFRFSFDNWDNDLALHPNNSIWILMLWYRCIVIANLALVIVLRHSLVFLLRPVIPFHLIRDAFSVAFGEIDRNLPFIGSCCH